MAKFFNKDIKILLGNKYDSRMGTHSYSAWTTGYDVIIEDDDGTVYKYRCRFYPSTTRVIPLTEEDDESWICDEQFHDDPTSFREVQWTDLAVAVRKEHFRRLFPQGTEEEMNVFVYGEEEGEKLNRRNAWAKDHCVHSEKISRHLIDDIGFYKDVEYLYALGRDQYYRVDDKLVRVYTVVSYHDGIFDAYEVSDYASVQAQQKHFGRRVNRLAKTAGVPWNIAKLVGIDDDQQAIAVLRQIKAKRGTASKKLNYELSCGIARRNAAIEQILGSDLFSQVSCDSQTRSEDLAYYLRSDLT